MANTQTSVGVFTTDANLIIQLWDATLERLTGISNEFASGQPLTVLLPDLEKRGLLTRFRRVLEHGVVEVLAPKFHHYLIHCPPVVPSKRFDKMRQRVNIAPLRDDDSIAGLIVTIEDVTERIEREINLSERLRQGDESIRLSAAQILADDSSLDASPLLDGLHDERWRVRRVAVKGMAHRAAPDAIAGLLRSVRENHQNPALLNSALQVLASSDVDTLSPLLEFLEGPDPDLRMQAALALGEQRDQRAVTALMKALSDDDTNVRYHVIEALGKLQALESVDSLVEIASTRDFFLAFPALDALAKIGDPRIVPQIVPFLEDELLREPAAGLLGQLGDENAVGPLTRLLNKPSAPTDLIAQALATLSDRYEIRYGEREHVVDLTRAAITPTGFENLLHALEEDREDLRSIALVVGWLRGPGVDRALTRLLGRIDLRDEVIAALVSHGSGTVDLLIGQLKAEDMEVRRSAVLALGRIGNSKATPALLEIIDDESLTIDVANSLAQIGDIRAIDGLVKLMGNVDGSIRQSAVAALNSLPVGTMADRIVPLLQNPDPNIRESAIKVAGYFGFPRATDSLLELCNDEDERVRSILAQARKEDTPKARSAAARALGNFDDKETASSLLAGLTDPDVWVRYFSARALGRRGNVEHVDALMEVTRKEEFNHVRIAALDSLVQIGGPRAVELAKELTEDKDSDLALAAVVALGKLDEPKVLPALLKALRSPFAEVRAGAAAALGERREADAWEELHRVALTDRVQNVVSAAILALKQIGTTDAMIVLVALTANTSLRELAISALASVPDDQIGVVAEGLSHQSPHVRRAILDVLARMRLPRATVLL